MCDKNGKVLLTLPVDEITSWEAFEEKIIDKDKYGKIIGVKSEITTDLEFRYELRPATSEKSENSK